MPQLDAACFAVVLTRFAQQYANRLNRLLLDSAPAHGVQWAPVPDNVVRVPLPAYSPELHPGERLWADLTQRIDGLDSQVRTSLPAL